MSQLIKLTEYGPASARMVSIGEYDFYFSYETIVAFRAPGVGLVCSENVWSVTTGKHISLIESDKRKRYKNEDFDEMLKKLVKQFEGLANQRFCDVCKEPIDPTDPLYREQPHEECGKCLAALKEERDNETDQDADFCPVCSGNHPNEGKDCRSYYPKKAS